MSADDPTVSPTETEPALPKVVRVALDKLVLDPNNPRIMDRIKPWPVPRERWADVGVQREVARALRGPSGRELDELINNLRMFGWLDVAPVRVQALEGDQYLVLDGNRRVEAVRECVTLNRDALLTVEQSVLPLRDGLLCLQVPMISDLAQKLTRAHAHLSGSGAWSAYQRAMVMLGIWRDAPWGSVLAAEALNVPKAEFEQMVSAAALCEQYRTSEHGAAFDEGQFGVFLQAFASDGIPRWIEWSATSQSPRNGQNTEKLFRWISTYSGLSLDARVPLSAMPVLVGAEADAARQQLAPPQGIGSTTPSGATNAEPAPHLDNAATVTTRGSSSASATTDHVDTPSARDTITQAPPPPQRGTDPAQAQSNAAQRTASDQPPVPESGSGLEPVRTVNLVPEKSAYPPLVPSTPPPLIAHGISPALLDAIQGLTHQSAAFDSLLASIPLLPTVLSKDLVSASVLQRYAEFEHATNAILASPYMQDLIQLNERIERSGVLERLADVIPLNAQVETKTQNTPSWRPRHNGDQAHLSTLTVAQYRSLTGLALDGLGRINLIVGENNSGKTSVLEAISLLMHQSDPREVLAALRRRARWDITKDAEWTAQELPALVQVTAHLNGMPSRESSVTLTRLTEPSESSADRVSFLCSLANESRTGGRTQRSTIDIWAGKEPKMQVHGERFWLGPIVFHSPFSSSDPETLQRANERAIQLGVKDRLMQFLRDEIDGDLKSIELVRDRRFRVSHNKRADSPDLSSFGDGLQRAFQIGLHLAAAAGGGAAH